MKKIVFALLVALATTTANADISNWTVTEQGDGDVFWGSTGDPTSTPFNYSDPGLSATSASASVDAFGSASLYDTSLISPVLDLSAGGATISYDVNFQDFAGRGDLDVDFSTNGGTTWTNIINYTDDTPAGGVNVVGGGVFNSVAIGTSSATTNVRFRFYDAVGGFDWYADIDNVNVYAGGAIVFSDDFEPTVIPEPTTAGLVMVGLVGLLVRRRR